MSSPLDEKINELEGTINDIQDSITNIRANAGSAGQGAGQRQSQSTGQGQSQGAGQGQSQGQARANNPIEVIRQSLDLKVWERLELHQTMFISIIKTFTKLNTNNLEYNKDIYYSELGNAILEDYGEKGIKVKGAASELIGDFIETKNNGMQIDPRIALEKGKKIMEEGIQGLLNNADYNAQIAKAKTVINSSTSRELLGNLLKKTKIFKEEEVDQMSGEEMYMRTTIAIDPELGPKEIKIAGAAFDKYDIDSKVKGLMKKSLGGLINQTSGGSQ